MPAYARAKAMEIAWARELQRRLRLAGRLYRDIDVFSVHPGAAAAAVCTRVS